MSFASVMFLCHSLPSSSFGILNMSFTVFSVIAFCHFLCYFLVMCFCNLHLAFDMSFFCLQSMCRFASVIVFRHVIRSFVPSFPVSFSSVIVFWHVVLSCASVISFVAFIWHSEVVIYSRVVLLTFFDMGEDDSKEGRRKEGGG